MKFKSKVSLAILLPVLVIQGIVSSVFALAHIWPGFILILALTGFVIYIFYSISYTVINEKLLVSSGIFYKKVIDIRSIIQIRDSADITSAPAGSLDRLEIRYGKRDRILVSPKNKNEFIASLLSINPAIVVNLKKEKV